jgi:hypothetical protein
MRHFAGLEIWGYCGFLSLLNAPPTRVVSEEKLRSMAVSVMGQEVSAPPFLGGSCAFVSPIFQLAHQDMSHALIATKTIFYKKTGWYSLALKENDDETEYRDQAAHHWSVRL